MYTNGFLDCALRNKNFQKHVTIAWCKSVSHLYQTASHPNVIQGTSGRRHVGKLLGSTGFGSIHISVDWLRQRMAVFAFSNNNKNDGTTAIPSYCQSRDKRKEACRKSTSYSSLHISADWQRGRMAVVVAAAALPSSVICRHVQKLPKSSTSDGNRRCHWCHLLCLISFHGWKSGSIYTVGI